MKVLKRLRWKFVELWDDLHYFGRRRTLRRHMCAFGLHWPVSFWDCRGGYSSPPEAGWACEMCGHERLPYRAYWWWPIQDLPTRMQIWLEERQA